MFSDIYESQKISQLIENVDDICRSSENDDFDKYLADRRFDPVAKTIPGIMWQEAPEETKGQQDRPRPHALAMGMQNTATLFRPLNEIIESATLKITEDTDEND